MLGWLHATPEGEKQNRMATEEWPMPEVKLSYIVQWFIDLRMSYGYTDIAAWSALTGSTPNPEEVRILISMTSTYSNSLINYRSKEHNLIPPYDGRTQKEIDDMISKKMMRSMARFDND